jgi:hypothetical protein
MKLEGVWIMRFAGRDLAVMLCGALLVSGAALVTAAQAPVHPLPPKNDLWPVKFAANPPRPASLKTPVAPAKNLAAVKAPGPLTVAQRVSAANAVRQAAGLNLAALGAIPPAHVVLTPDAPKSGKSYFCLYEAHSFPDAGFGYYFGYLPPTMTCSLLGSESNMEFCFHTLPGATYMVDITIGPPPHPMPSQKPPAVRLCGALSDEVAIPPQGHIVVGFTANDSVTWLGLTPVLSGGGLYFFRCELTRVN